jgi:hypothetical protein
MPAKMTNVKHLTFHARLRISRRLIAPVRKPRKGRIKIHQSRKRGAILPEQQTIAQLAVPALVTLLKSANASTLDIH